MGNKKLAVELKKRYGIPSLDHYANELDAFEKLTLAQMRQMPKGLTYEERVEWLSARNLTHLIGFLRKPKQSSPKEGA